MHNEQQNSINNDIVEDDFYNKYADLKTKRVDDYLDEDDDLIYDSGDEDLGGGGKNLHHDLEYDDEDDDDGDNGDEDDDQDLTDTDDDQYASLSDAYDDEIEDDQEYDRFSGEKHSIASIADNIAHSHYISEDDDISGKLGDGNDFNIEADAGADTKVINQLIQSCDPQRLDNVTFNVTAEVGRVVFSLRQLLSMQVGDVFDFSGLPAKVKLMTNGLFIGDGYLVEINGRVGVKIASLSGNNGTAITN